MTSPELRPSRFAQSIHPTLIRVVSERARPTSLHLGLGQPDLPLAPWARDALASVSLAPYGPNRGRPELVERIATKYGGAGVIVTSGTQEALSLAVLGLVEPGWDVLVPDPGFPAYPNLVRAAGARPVPYALGDAFALDVDEVLAAWTPATRAVVLNSPSNPTGAVASEAATRAVVALCEDRGAFFISDEIYEDFVWEGAHFSPSAFGWNGVVASGLSKSHAAMGLRVGWLAGPAEVLDRLVPLHQHLVTCASWASQQAAIAMLDHHEEQVASMTRVFGQRRDVTRASISSWPVPPPRLDGAFYAFVDVRGALAEGESTLDLALRILEEQDVVTIPGAGFGARGEGFLRLAYTVEQTILTEALHRVGDFLLERSTR